MKNHITRKGRLLGGYVPTVILDGVREWVAQHPERDLSTFVREAAREKLRREGITVIERRAA